MVTDETQKDKDRKRAEDERQKRLSARLRANLQRRKVQHRARRAGEEDDRDGLGTPRTEKE